MFHIFLMNWFNMIICEHPNFVSFSKIFFIATLMLIENITHYEIYFHLAMGISTKIFSTKILQHVIKHSTGFRKVFHDMVVNNPVVYCLNSPNSVFIKLKFLKNSNKLLAFTQQIFKYILWGSWLITSSYERSQAHLI